MCEPTTLLGFGEERILWLDGLVWKNGSDFQKIRAQELLQAFCSSLKYVQSWSERQSQTPEAVSNLCC